MLSMGGKHLRSYLDTAQQKYVSIGLSQVQPRALLEALSGWLETLSQPNGRIFRGVYGRGNVQDYVPAGRCRFKNSSRSTECDRD